MNWKDVVGLLPSGLEIIGKAIGGPVGVVAQAAGGLAAKALGVDPTPEAVAHAIKTDPDAAVKLAQIQADERVELARINAEHETINLQEQVKALQAVNETMRAEAASDHWPTYSWRPFIGFAFGLYIIALFMLPLFGKQPVILSPDITLAIGGILGVASWFRGKAQADPNVRTDNRG